MSSAFRQFNPTRLRSYILRIPVCTRILLGVILLFWLGSIYGGFSAWARLEPNAVFKGGAHRLTTYAFLHLGFIHLFFNLIVLIPLLERFEAEHGSLITFVLFTGPFTTFPGVAYTLLCTLLFRSNTPILGSSVWTFLLITSYATQTARGTPSITIATYRIPTLALPFLGIVLTHFLIPHTSLVGHLCGAAMGWAWGAGWLKFLIPPERILRWVEEKGKLLQRVPHYVSVDQKTFGRYGVLPTVSGTHNGNGHAEIGLSGLNGGGRRLGP